MHPTMTCTNCNTPLKQEDVFCGHCGQRTATEDDFTISTLLHELAGSIFSVDSKLIKTMRVLYIPGKYYLDFVTGKRARYMQPYKLFVFFTIFVFGLGLSFNNDGIQIDIGKNITADSLTWGDYKIPPDTIADHTTDELAEMYPNTEFLDEFWFKQVLHFYKDKAGYIAFIRGKVPWAFFFFIPLMALCSFLLEWKNKTKYLKHTLFWTNVVSAFLLVYSLSLLISSSTQVHLIAVLLAPIFTLWSIQRVFPTRNKWILIVKWLTYSIFSLASILVCITLIFLVGTALF